MRARGELEGRTTELTIFKNAVALAASLGSFDEILMYVSSSNDSSRSADRSRISTSPPLSPAIICCFLIITSASEGYSPLVAGRSEWDCVDDATLARR